MTDHPDALAALAEAMKATRRLADRGLAIDQDDSRGLTREGIQVLGDLLAVLKIQTQQSPDPIDRLVSTSCQATMLALLALTESMAGRSHLELATTLRHIRDAHRQALEAART